MVMRTYVKVNVTEWLALFLGVRTEAAAQNKRSPCIWHENSTNGASETLSGKQWQHSAKLQ